MKSSYFRSAKWSATKFMLGVMLIQIVLFGGVAFLWGYFEMSMVMDQLKIWLHETTTGRVVGTVMQIAFALLAGGTYIFSQRPTPSLR